MIATIKELVQLGYNTYIAHAFIGLEGGLVELSGFLSKHGSKLVLVTSMSHKGSTDVIDKGLPPHTRSYKEA